MQVTSFLDKFEGKPLNSPNDMVYARDGGLYFSDPPYFFADPVSGKTVDARYRQGARQGPDDQQCRIASRTASSTAVITDLPRPNGIGFSPDGKTIYVSNTENPKQQLLQV